MWPKAVLLTLQIGQHGAQTDLRRGANQGNAKVNAGAMVWESGSSLCS